MERRCKVDWLSFTLETEEQPRSGRQLELLARTLISMENKYVYELIFENEAFVPIPARAPYRVGIGNADHTVRLYGSSHTNTVLTELSGRWCTKLDTLETAQRFILPIASRLTRLDTATDILTRTSPVEFTNAGYSARFKSTGHIVSTDGETCYVGSPRSDRFARVYRYNPPHPRAAWLRVECIFRRKLAPLAAEAINTASSWTDVHQRLGATFGWKHSDYGGDASGVERISTGDYSTKQELNTVAWLYKQVAPAMKRLIDSGALSPTEFLEHVYSL